MKVVEEALNGLMVIEPRVFGDSRGVFFESFNRDVFAAITGSNEDFIQDNHSVSLLNVVRGLHLQVPPFAQGKLVRVVKGRVYDVAVDVRKNSPTYGQHFGLELSAENNLMFWIPPGFAHGFSALENDSVFLYKCTKQYDKASERTILFNDPQLGINWKVSNPIISDKDKEGELFAAINLPF